MITFLYTVTAVLYGLFIVRFALSWILGDFDIDTDLDLSDIVSFKGFSHFLMGFCGWLSSKQYLANEIAWYDWLIAFVIGLIFMIVLYFTYKLMFKLESLPKVLSGEQLIGSTGQIYLKLPMENGSYKYIITVNNGVGTVELQAKSEQEYRTGDIVTIVNYKNGVYLV